MKHWHFIGSKNNRLCSSKHFYSLYNNINIDIKKLIKDKIDIVKFHNNYHKENILNTINKNHHYDLEKRKIAENNGFSYLVLWDEDPTEENINKIENFLNKNKIKYKYNENDKNKIIKKAKPRKTNLGS